uniref:Ig-like domain-containing protein n=1 Tax=Sander lucioperca TaxID=283035 RepID=A0A8D0AYY5_SANLU
YMPLCCIVMFLEAQEVKVLPEVTGYLGRDVTLPCQFIQAPQGSNITQVQWDLISPEGKEILIIVFNVQFGLNVPESFKGRVDIAEQSLIIRGVEMRDAGSYTCSIASFPSGSLKGTTNLVVQGEYKKLMLHINYLALIIHLRNNLHNIKSRGRLYLTIVYAGLIRKSIWLYYAFLIILEIVP